MSTNYPLDLQQAQQILTTLRQQINQQLIGQSVVVDQVLVALLAGGHVLIEGVPGLGKTLLVRVLAHSFNGDFARVQFTPDLMPSDVTGHALYDLNTRQLQIRRGPIFTNLLLADEINRAPAKTQAALLEVMQEHQVTIEGQSMATGSPFMVLATQNPIEQEGTYPLPEAELDRFLMKIYIDYPSHEDEVHMVSQISRRREDIATNQLNALLQASQLVEMQQLARELMIDQGVIDYAVRLVRATRDWPGLALGAGPRASLALVACARAQALLQARDFVTPDDVRDVALPVLRHRIQLAAELELEGLSGDQVLHQLIQQVTAPRL